MRGVTKPERYGAILFADIKTIRHSRFSHYLIENEIILELNSMKAIYLELKEIDDMLDKSGWGLLYPIFKFFKHLKFKRTYTQLRARPPGATTSYKNGRLVGLNFGSGIGLTTMGVITWYYAPDHVIPTGSVILLIMGLVLIGNGTYEYRKVVGG